MLVILSALLILFQFGPSSATLPIALSSDCDSIFSTKKIYCDNTYGNYTSNSSYKQNLNTLLSDISSNTKVTSGFYNLSYGKEPNRANGLALCRGDVSLAQCRSCLKLATGNLLATCTNQKQAIRWYDNCMVRYTNRTIVKVSEISPFYAFRNELLALDQNDFDRVLLDLFGILLSQTVLGNSTLKFAMEKINVSTSETIYAYTQCTPDLSQSECHKCLSQSISYIPRCCLPYQGLRYFQPSCSIRYEIYNFSKAFDTLAYANSSGEISFLPPTMQLSSPQAPGLWSRASVVLAVISVVAIVCLSLCVVVYLCSKKDMRERNKGNVEEEEEDEITTMETLQIAYDDIKQATQGFAEANTLGRGGFGVVYKGMLANGQEIAVKRLAKNSVQGEEEFRTEVLLVAKLQHRNLVRLLGYSLEGEERLLIYEFVPNASLDHFLFDFGMARLFQADQTHADTEKIAGTFGYMAPEYAYRGIFSVKSDVYSFGVLVLEIITGQKNSSTPESESMDDLLTSVWRNWREGTTYKVVDTTLETASRAKIMRCLQLGLLCVQADPVNRPTMSSVNLMLSSESQSMVVPSQPAYVLHRSMEFDPKSFSATEEESITDLHPR